MQVIQEKSKGGKFIFGASLINNDLSIKISPIAVKEYDITSEEKIYLIFRSKATGGVIVTRKKDYYTILKSAIY